MPEFKNLKHGNNEVAFEDFKINYIFILSLIAMSFIVSCKNNKEQQFRKHIANAIEYNNSKEFINAIGEANKAIVILPESEVGYLIRGKSYNSLKNIKML